MYLLLVVILYMTTLTSNNSDVIRYTKKERDFLQKKSTILK